MLLTAPLSILQDQSKAITREELIKELERLNIRIPPNYVQVVMSLADEDGRWVLAYIASLPALFHSPQTLSSTHHSLPLTWDP